MADRAKSTTRFASSESDTAYPLNSRRIWFSSQGWTRADDRTPRMRRRHCKAGSKRLRLPALQARPIQAALTSALTFAVGAALPLLVASLSPSHWLVTLVGGASLVCLGLLGAVAAGVGGSRRWVGTLRVVFWGALAMGLTAAIGKLFGVVAA